MYGTQQKIPSEGCVCVSGGKPETLYTQQSVVCMEEKKLAGVCFALIKRNSGNKRKAYGKVDQVFCLRGEKDAVIQKI